MDHHAHHHDHVMSSTQINNISNNMINDHSMHMMHTNNISMGRSHQMDHNMGGHSMAFHFGYDQILFFNSWKIHSPITLIYACLGIFVASVLYEGLKVFREYLMSHPLFTDPYYYSSSPWTARFINLKKGGSTRRQQRHDKHANQNIDDADDGRHGDTGHKKGCCALKNSPLTDRATAAADIDNSKIDTPYVKINDELPQKYSELNVAGFKSCNCKSSPSFSLPDHVIQSCLHMVQTCIGFLLMLVFMTFNVWLCLALIAGAGFGYFCFAWKRRIAIVDVTQHCN